MSQATNPSISANPSGVAYRTQDNDRYAAHLTQHSGSSRPSYAVKGTVWLDTSVSPHLVCEYDGSQDCVIGLLDATTHEFIPLGADKALWGGTSSGAANVYAVTIPKAPAAYYNGMTVYYIAHQDNAGAATLNVSALGAKAQKKNGTAALDGGDIKNTCLVKATYDGTNFQIVPVSLALSGGSMAGVLNYAKGADIASAGTTDIGAATGNVVDVTGTTTITALGTVQAGTQRWVRFTGALTLTHNGTSLILPGAANLTTAAGDVAGFISLGSGNWLCSTYLRLSSALPLATLDTDTALAANSDARVASQKAVKAYIDAGSGGTRLDGIEGNLGLLFLGLARLTSSTAPEQGGNEVPDEFDDATGVGSLGSGTVASGYLGNGSSTVQTTTQTGTPSGGGNYPKTIVDELLQATNSTTVTAIGYNSTIAGAFKVKIFLRNGAGNYTCVYSEAVTHGGGGWQDFTLATPYAVPGSGTYYIGCYSAVSLSAVTAGGSGALAYIASDVTGTDAGFTEAASGGVQMPIMRYSKTTGAANITTVSVAYTAAAVPTDVTLVAEYQDVATTSTVNTDITFEVSRDNGTTWTAVTMTDFGPGQVSGTRVLKGAVSVAGQPSGTSMKWRIKTLNTKEQRVHGIWMQWR